MGALFIGAGIFATIPALFMGVNNGATLLGVIIMAIAGTRIVRGLS